MKKSWILVPIVLVLIAVASYAVYVFLSPSPPPDGIVYANGRIEGTEIRISAEVAGRVVGNWLKEGAEVATGDLLVELDSADYEFRLGQAEATAKAIEQELRGLTVERETLRHHLQTAAANLERLRSLRREDVATQQQLDVAEDRHRESSGAVERLSAGISQAEAKHEAAQHDVEYLRRQISKTRIAAPSKGTVLVKAVEHGEYAAPGQAVALLTDMSALKLKVYVPENDLGKIKLGTPVRMRVDAFPDQFFSGTVAQIDQHAQFTPKDIHMPQERARVVFGIEISVENSEGYLKPGMPADAWIRWKDGTPWPETLSVPGA